MILGTQWYLNDKRKHAHKQTKKHYVTSTKPCSFSLFLNLSDFSYFIFLLAHWCCIGFNHLLVYKMPLLFLQTSLSLSLFSHLYSTHELYIYKIKEQRKKKQKNRTEHIYGITSTTPMAKSTNRRMTQYGKQIKTKNKKKTNLLTE